MGDLLELGVELARGTFIILKIERINSNARRLRRLPPAFDLNDLSPLARFMSLLENYKTFRRSPFIQSLIYNQNI